MHPIIYDVAVSLDGYISGPGGDISGFAHDGPVVDDYNARMADYAVAIMGRSTYEFGYQFGLEAGQNPYRHMKTFVFSKTLQCPVNSEITVVRSPGAMNLQQLKETSQGPIYLCGGGAFAGSLLSDGLIDQLRLKRAPIILGGGVRLCGHHPVCARPVPMKTKVYDNGYVFQEFQL
ncbi:MAG: dihydrofolate reductase family protein [Stappiaceae bacterium]